MSVTPARADVSKLELSRKATPVIDTLYDFSDDVLNWQPEQYAALAVTLALAIAGSLLFVL